MRPFPVLLTLLLLTGQVGYAQVFDLVVAQDGTGDYTSIGSAINRIRSTDSRYLIYVKAGTYQEKVSVAFNNISLIGEDVDQVIISWDDYSGDAQGHTTSSSYTFETSGDGFYAENITFENTAGNVGQAVAVSTLGNQQAFKNCKFLGFQDTYYARKGMQYFTECYIEGATDFIFGEATTIFQNCQIRCVEGGQYITAPADTKLITETANGSIYHGLLFLNSEISAAEDVSASSYFLGRPWQPNSSAVYVNCTLGNHIRSEGWSEWDNANHESAKFSEYASITPEGDLVDVSGRVSWSTQLTSQQVDDYYNLDYFLNGWDPIPAITPLVSPSDLHQSAENEDAYELNWEPVADAIGYVITRNDSTFGFSETTAFIDPSSTSGDWYKVRAVSATGALSSYSNQVAGASVGATVLSATEANGFWIRQGTLESSERMNVKIYTISGRLVFKESNTQRIDLNEFQRGVYLIKIETMNGAVITKKVAI